jgi:ketosteroid isomerase-like protein
MPGSDIEHRLQAVEDKDAIRELTARYCHLVREGDVDGYAALFTPGATFESGDRRYEGHDELRAMLVEASERVRPSPFIQNHVIELDGERATGRCSVEIRLVQSGEAYTAAGHYRDSYRRVDGAWLFERRVLEIEHWVPLSDGWAGTLAAPAAPAD